MFYVLFFSDSFIKKFNIYLSSRSFETVPSMTTLWLVNLLTLTPPLILALTPRLLTVHFIMADFEIVSPLRTADTVPVTSNVSPD